MSKRIIPLIGVLLLAGFGFCFRASSAGEAKKALAADNRFAFELYSRYKPGNGNIFFSPYSISSALAMVYEGGRGGTRNEIQKVFHFPADDKARRDEFLSAYNRLNRPDKKYQLSTANALWAQKDFALLEEYPALVKRYYGGKASGLDFINETDQARLTINKWVEDRTNKKIKDLIPPDMLGMETRLVLTNAVYFKGKWDKQFDKRNTREKDFILSPGRNAKVQMMNYVGARLNYAETSNLQILELPYEGQELSMLVLLPKTGNLAAVEEELSAEKVAAWRTSLQNEKVDVYLPRFRFDSKYLMKDTLAQMGMPSAFSMLDSDFSGLTGKRDLYLGQVIHQAFAEVNEEGTEAAAATAVEMKKSSPGPDMRTRVFNADHPFIFIIQEKKTGLILFMGRLGVPASDL